MTISISTTVAVATTIVIMIVFAIILFGVAIYFEVGLYLLSGKWRTDAPISWTTGAVEAAKEAPEDSISSRSLDEVMHGVGCC